MATNISLNLYGVGGASSQHPNRGAIELTSVSWGFDLSPGAGTFAYGPPVIPTVLTATLFTGRESPQLMNRMLGQAELTTGVIRVHQPDAGGIERVAVTITLHNVHVVDFRQHLGGEEYLDTVQLTFSGLDYDYPPGPTATYAIPA